MKVTLPTGDIVQITPAMATSVRRATPVPNNPYFLELLEYDSTRSMGALVQQGLAVYSARRDGWVLTPLGIELLVELRRLSHEKEEKKNSGRMRGNSPSETVGPRRATLHPEISMDQARRLHHALEQRRVRGATGRKGPTAPEKFLGGGTPRTFFFVVVGFVLLFVLANQPELFLLFVVVALIGVVWWYVRRRMAQQKRQRLRAQDPDHIVAGFRGRYVVAAMLDRPSDVLLGRTQRAVDTVLGSPLHRQGLLLDEVRNRVVLADIEWSLALSLVQQSRTRDKIDSTPTPGERSRQAAERARAVLAEDVEEVEARIRTLEDYADKVRAAELEEQDQRAAAEFEKIANQAAEAQAAHPHQNEALTSLVQAQNLALQIEALSPGTED